MEPEEVRGEWPTWVAYHEAGHAIVADYLGVLEWVQLDPEPETASDSDTEVMDGPILYAGPLAQARHQRASLSGVFLHSGRGDFRELMQLVSQPSAGIPPEVRLGAYREIAHTILAARWPAVEAVAAALLERGYLMDDDVRGIVRAHVSDDPIVPSWLVRS